jgi:hypothetical protein
MAIQNSDLLIAYRPGDSNHYKLSIDSLGDYIDSTYGSYLRIDAAAGDQTVASTGTTTFDGVTTHAKGVKVTGGNSSVTNGIGSDGTSLNFYANSEDRSVFKPGEGFTLTFANNLKKNFGEVVRLGGLVSRAQDGDNQINKVCSISAIPNFSGTVNLASFGFSHYKAAIVTGVNNDTSNIQSIAGYYAQNSIGARGSLLNYGFLSDLDQTADDTTEGKQNYNFAALGTAPNFFQGDTYIGGTTTRNTRELWESLLTEEQKEELAAGTLVVPADVSTPGDGEFARQWWYDQQDEETQALIDAGELDYPEHFQAANFVDTFDLGVTTNINLLASDGRGEFSGGVKVTGGNILDGTYGVAAPFHLELYSARGVRTTSFVPNAFHSGNVGSGLTSSTTLDYGASLVNGAVIGVQNIEILNATTSDNIAIFSSKGSSTNSPSSNPGWCASFLAAADTTFGSDANYGFASFLNTDSDKNYNFYADGTAPNFFKGDTYFGGEVSSTALDPGAYITSGGTAMLSDGVILGPRPASGTTGGEFLNFGYRADPNNTKNVSQFKGYSLFDGVSSDANIVVFDAQVDFNAADGSLNQIYGFRAGESLGKKSASARGFTSDLKASTSFNFYAAGTAPNYFAGNIIIASNPEFDPTSSDADSGAIFSKTQVRLKSTNNTQNAAGFSVIRLSSETVGAATAIFQNFTYECTADQQKVSSIIRMDGTGGVAYGATSDYRAKENIADLPSAVDSIKSLRPVNYNYTWAPGKTRPGFVAHELQETVPAAVVGEKDEEEAIGTLADYDGIVLETEVTEPSELEYTEDVETDGVTTQVVRTRTWTPTGTRPVYQGVDQTKLIPLLTKALQEALERIETLEALIS